MSFTHGRWIVVVFLKHLSDLLMRYLAILEFYITKLVADDVPEIVTSIYPTNSFR